MINELSAGVFLGLTVMILVLSSIDKRRSRTVVNRTPVSVLVPCFNDGGSVSHTIESIYDSYHSDLTEVLVIDDGSTDNSLAALETLQKRYPFRLVNNRRNLGKAESLNTLAAEAKNEILIFIDADILANRDSFHDVLARFEKTRTLGAVSCPYKPLNKGFLPLMQNVEYNMLALIQGSYNLFSAMALWGGFLAVRKEAFLEVGKFSVNAITEDLDLAFKLNGKGWRVEQSFYPVLSIVPGSLGSWLRQKVRWTSGCAQCFVRHFNVWIRNPIQLVFILSYSFLTVSSAYLLFSDLSLIDMFIRIFTILETSNYRMAGLRILAILYWPVLVREVLPRSLFVLVTLVYVFPLIKRAGDLAKLLLIFPFSFAYFPGYVMVSAFGVLVGLRKLGTLRTHERAW